MGVASAANGPGGAQESLLSFDAEALHLFADGSGYVSDEYGTYIARFDSSKQITSLTQFPETARPHKPLGTLNFDAIAAPTNGRRNNQGLEGLSVTPDGTRLFALLQSATVQDTNGSQQQTRTNARLLDAAGNIVSYGDGRLNAGITNDAIFYAFRITIDADGKRFYRFAIEEQ